jgi:hypothetical protein
LNLWHLRKHLKSYCENSVAIVGELVQLTLTNNQLFLMSLKLLRKLVGQLRIVIEPKVIEFDPERLVQWRKANDGKSYGFGETIVGEHFEELGYRWIYHDFNVFGGNRPGKYPLAEEILFKYLGPERFEAARKISEVLSPFADPHKHVSEEPDLLVYKPDLSEIRFVESKRLDTKDKLNKKQVRGLMLLSAFLGFHVDVFIVAPKGKEFKAGPIVFNSTFSHRM